MLSAGADPTHSKARAAVGARALIPASGGRRNTDRRTSRHNAEVVLTGPLRPARTGPARRIAASPAIPRSGWRYRRAGTPDHGQRGARRGPHRKPGRRHSARAPTDTDRWALA